MKILFMGTLAMAATLATGAARAEDAGAVARGHIVFQKWCTPCHAPEPREDGMLLPGTDTLNRRYNGSEPAGLEQRTDLTAPYVEQVMRRGLRAMPQFRKTEISDDEMHDVVAYLLRDHRAPVSSNNFLQPYYGNTFISHHADGVEYRVLYSADGRFQLVRRGGNDRTADYEISGTYTIDGNRVCYHADHPPPQALTCVPQDQGRHAGETWKVTADDGTQATHMIVAGQRLHDPVAIE